MWRRGAARQGTEGEAWRLVMDPLGPCDPGPRDPGPRDLDPRDLGPPDLEPPDLEPARQAVPGPPPPRAALLAAARAGLVLAAPALSFLRFLRDTVIPARCPACRGIVAAPALCAPCWAQVRWIAPPLCDRLGLPLPFEEDVGGLSLAARAAPPPYARARAAALHDGPAKRAVHALKYEDRQDLGPMLGLWLARAGAELLGEADVVVPVPLHPLRLLLRGFNQSGVLAARMVAADARLTGRRLPVVEALRRVRRTRAQVGLGQGARRRNVAGAFAVREARLPAITGRSVLLLDDVVTTGATIEACARALKRAGAARVDVLSVTRVPARAGDDPAAAFLLDG